MFGKEKKQSKRFEIIHKERMGDTIRIIRDKETGVNYLFHNNGYGGGLCPLMDKTGKPVVTQKDPADY